MHNLMIHYVCIWPFRKKSEQKFKIKSRKSTENFNFLSNTYFRWWFSFINISIPHWPWPGTSYYRTPRTPPWVGLPWPTLSPCWRRGPESAWRPGSTWHTDRESINKQPLKASQPCKKLALYQRLCEDVIISLCLFNKHLCGFVWTMIFETAEDQ